jgi:hypothetical protein
VCFDSLVPVLKIVYFLKNFFSLVDAVILCAVFWITVNCLLINGFQSLGVLSIVNLEIGIYALFKSDFMLSASGDDKMFAVLLLE